MRVLESIASANYRYDIYNSLLGTIINSYDENDIDNVSSKKLVKYKDLIDKSIKSTDDDLSIYLAGNLSNKIEYISIDTIVIDDELYGRTKVYSSSELNDLDIEKLIDYLTTQFKNGWGSIFYTKLIYAWEDNKQLSISNEEIIIEDNESITYNLYVDFYQDKNYEIYLGNKFSLN